MRASREWPRAGSNGVLRRALACTVTCALVGCAAPPARAPVVDDEALLGRLGFIQLGRVERQLVESRLGEPLARYESGRVVSYAVYLSRGRLQLQPGGECFALMIEYAPDGAIARRALVRQGSLHCWKG